MFISHALFLPSLFLREVAIIGFRYAFLWDGQTIYPYPLYELSSLFGIMSSLVDYDINLHLSGVYDPQDPFNDGATPNSWTPPLNTSWNWATNRAYGVNLGGLFVLEPFITPAIFQKYPSAIDEWTLSEAMAADTGPGGGLQPQLEAHYDTFIVRLIRFTLPGSDLPLSPTLYHRGVRAYSFTD